MKNLKHLLQLFALILITSCSLTVDVDNEDELAKISASAVGNNRDGTVSEGGFIDLEVDIFDRDGVQSVRIEIPALNIDFSTNISNRSNKHNIRQSFNVDEIDNAAPKLIYLTITDYDGNVYDRALNFSVQ
ncbi:MAG: hypothetical protein AB8B59_14535 [Maribacter sp.]